MYYNIPKINLSKKIDHFPDLLTKTNEYIFNVSPKFSSELISYDIDIHDQSVVSITETSGDIEDFINRLYDYLDATDAQQGLKLKAGRTNVPLSEFNETYFKTKQDEINTSLTSAYWENNIDGFYTKYLPSNSFIFNISCILHEIFLSKY